MSRTELEAAAVLATGRVKGFEERGAKPWASTRARLAKVLRAPDLERFGGMKGRNLSPQGAQVNSPLADQASD
jgi:hypothetical protein